MSTAAKAVLTAQMAVTPVINGEQVMTGLSQSTKNQDCVAGAAKPDVWLQVFIAEQVLYTKGDLHKHVRTGDLEGPLAESGFKGHPDCRSPPHQCAWIS